MASPTIRCSGKGIVHVYTHAIRYSNTKQWYSTYFLMWDGHFACSGTDLHLQCRGHGSWVSQTPESWLPPASLCVYCQREMNSPAATTHTHTELYESNWLIIRKPRLSGVSCTCVWTYCNRHTHYLQLHATYLSCWASCIKYRVFLTSQVLKVSPTFVMMGS